MKSANINLLVTLSLMFAATLIISCNMGKRATTGTPPMDPYAGTWDYVVTGTPDGEIKGELVISMDSDQYTAMMKSAAGTLDINDVVITDNKMTGNFSYQGYTVDLSGMFSGAKFDGEVSVDYNAFPMTAVKRNP